MSDENQINEEIENDADAEAEVSERDILVTRANQLGIKFSPNIGTDTLRERVSAALNDEPAAAPAEAEGELSTQEIHRRIRETQKKEQLKLVRLRITNLNPNKKELMGEIFTVANNHVGIVKKFVPYGEATEDGYHVPYIIYTQLKSRRFLNIKTKRNRQTGQIEVEQNWAPEFALEVLDPLTPEQLRQLANRQAAAAGLAS